MQCAPTGCKRAVGIRPAALLFAVALLAAGLPMPALADQVVWSDGESWHGRLQPSGQGDLRFHDGQRLWQWRLDQVLAFDWHPATQRMERAWRFLEAGQTACVETGEP